MGLLRGSMLKTVVTILGLTLTACSVGAVNGAGDDDTDAPAGDPRAASFANEVLPIVMNKGCLNISCHGGVQNPQMSTFDKMTTNGIAGRYIVTPAASNIIITKDAPTPGTHQGMPYLSAPEKTSISTWIESAP